MNSPCRIRSDRQVLEAPYYRTDAMSSVDASKGLRKQRRGRSIAMSTREVDDFLAAERTCRVATIDGNGRPDITPLWFVWDGAALWLNSLYKSQRWTNLARNPETAIVVDAGEDYSQLRGVQISGRAEVIGEVPRTDRPNAVLEPIEVAFAQRYIVGGTFEPDGRHAWLRVTPRKIVSWDFRKSSAL
jgi:nitroimidazol reductase NimA-like FMN-containing flavoprotein (pyridoxamine 5'-phosphate oxidase superfamily)